MDCQSWSQGRAFLPELLSDVGEWSGYDARPQTVGYFCNKLGIPFPTDQGSIAKVPPGSDQRNPYYASMVNSVDWIVGKLVKTLGDVDDPRNPGLLFAVGFPEVIDEFHAMRLISTQQGLGFNVDEIFQKEKSVAGEFGAKFMVVSAADGKTISETKLDYPAVFDGMSAGNGNIFISDIKGNVICLQPSEVKK